jgi:hypothetical protein
MESNDKTQVWTFYKETDGVKIFVRPPQIDTGLKRIRGEKFIAGFTPQEVASVIRNSGARAKCNNHRSYLFPDFFAK